MQNIKVIHRSLMKHRTAKEPTVDHDNDDDHHHQLGSLLTCTPEPRTPVVCMYDHTCGRLLLKYRYTVSADVLTQSR